MTQTYRSPQATYTIRLQYLFLAKQLLCTLVLAIRTLDFADESFAALFCEPAGRALSRRTHY